MLKALFQETAGKAWGHVGSSMAASASSNFGESLLQMILLPGSCQCHTLGMSASRAISSSTAAGEQQHQQGPAAVSSPSSTAGTSSSSASATTGGNRKDRQPVASPLASLQKSLEKLSKEAGLVELQAGVAVRSWQWYDRQDEREWQQRELRRHYPNAGYAHMQHVPTSVKKMDRILRVVRGLQLQDAMHQLKAVPHKAARYAEQVLDYAADDAEEKGLQETKLVVDTVYATKGTHYKKPAFRGKGKIDMQKSRTCHVRVLLRELPVPQFQGFQTQLLPPLTLQPAANISTPAQRHAETLRSRMSPLRLTQTARGTIVSKRRLL